MSIIIQQNFRNLVFSRRVQGTESLLFTKGPMWTEDSQEAPQDTAVATGIAIGAAQATPVFGAQVNDRIVHATIGFFNVAGPLIFRLEVNRTGVNDILEFEASSATKEFLMAMMFFGFGTDTVTVTLQKAPAASTYGLRMLYGLGARQPSTQFLG